MVWWRRSTPRSSKSWRSGPSCSPGQAGRPKQPAAPGMRSWSASTLRGDPLQKIGERHGLSHQRVRHLMLAFGACRVPEPPRRCSICPEPVEAFGLCRFHYYRQRTYGDPEFVPRRGVNADHGTVSRYWAGCRCAACRAANAALHHEGREHRRRALATATVTHGSASTYRNWGCRCEPCHQAALAGAALARAARRARRQAQAPRRRVRDPHKGPARGHPCNSFLRISQRRVRACTRERGARIASVRAYAPTHRICTRGRVTAR